MHTDIPTRAEIDSLLRVGGEACVSLYQATTPITVDAAGDRIVFKNLLAQARTELESSDVDGDDQEAIETALTALGEDDEFWAHQANSLAVFATPTRLRTYRLANRLEEMLSVSDRFEIKPLLRSLTFGNAALVLALAQGSARLFELGPELPATEISVPGMPADAADAAGKASIGDRSPSGRLQGDEGKKVLIRQYARKVDTALRGVIAGRELPLILAATQPLDSIFRSVNSYSHLADETIAGSPETLSESELSDLARPVLDRLASEEMAALASTFATRRDQGRAVDELSGIARAAGRGAIDTLWIDFDERLTGTIDDATGAIELSESGAEGNSITDEIVRHVLGTGGRVLAVRRGDIPGGGPAAALLRYPV